MAALDTNIFVYAEVEPIDRDELNKTHLCRQLLSRLVAEDALCVAAQTIAELHHVFTRKLRLTRLDASDRIQALTRSAKVIATTETLLTEATALSVRHGLAIFDAIILAAAAEARCDMLYSEDFHHGFAWRGVEVVNPFL